MRPWIQYLALASVAIICVAVYYFGMPFSEQRLEAAEKNCEHEAPTAQNACFQKLAEALAKEPTEVRTRFIENTLHSPAFLGTCHLFMHFLGSALYQKSNSLVSALDSCTLACSAGCYHGAAEKYFTERIRSGTPLTVTGFANEAAKMNTCSREATQCEHGGDAIHGFGHALMDLTGSDLPYSLTLCDALTAPEGCYAGVFMSNYMSLTDDSHPSRFIRADDALYPCTILDARYQKSCYANQADFFLGPDIVKNTSLCRTFPVQYQSACLLRVPNLAVQRITDVHEMNSVCSVIPNTKEQELCIEGIVDRLKDRKTDGVSDAKIFCETVQDAFKKSCQARI